MADNEFTARVRYVEHGRYLIVAALVAVIPTLAVLAAWVLETPLSTSARSILAGMYLAAGLTLFVRPVTGSIERSVWLTKLRFAVIGLGFLAAAGNEFLVEEAYGSGAVFLLFGLLPFLLMTRGSIWEAYRERCRDRVATYRDAVERASSEGQRRPSEN